MRIAPLWLALLGCSGPVFQGAGGAGGTGGTGGTGGAGGAPLPPGDPGPVDVRIDVDSGAGVHAISPWIYGTNQPDWTGKSKYLTLARAGGNRLTAYNWENHASNAGTDYLNQSDGFLGGGDIPGEAMRVPIAAALTAGASFIQTIPIAGYVAADKLGGGDVNQTPNYLATRFRVDVAHKGSPFAYPPDLN